MGVYSKLKSKAKTLVDTVFAGATDNKLKEIDLLPFGRLGQRLKILYPDDPKLRQQVEDDYKVCAAVRIMGKKMGAAQIGRQIGRSRSVVKEWLRGSRPGKFARLSDLGESSIPTNKSVEFASLLGFVLSTRGKHSRTDAFEVGSKDKRVLKEFDSTVQKLWGRKTTDIKGKGGDIGVKLIISKELRNYVGLVTNGFTTLPWEHLLEEDERKAFLTAWLSNSSAIMGPVESKGKEVLASGKEDIRRRKAVVDLDKTLSGEDDPRLGLLHDLRILLLKQGFGNSLIKQGKNRHTIRIHDQDDLQRLVDEKYFIQGDRRQRLNKFIRASRKFPKGMKTRHDYHNFREQMSAGMEFNKALTEFDLGEELALKWLRGQQRPTAAKWDDEVRELEEKRKPDEIGYAFRNIDPEPGEARKLAGGNSMEQLVTLGARRNIQGFLWNRGYPLLPDEYEQVASCSDFAEARGILEPMLAEIEERRSNIRSALMFASKWQVLKVIENLPDHKVLETSLLRERSGEEVLPFTTVSLDKIVLSIARRPELVKKILDIPLPEQSQIAPPPKSKEKKSYTPTPIRPRRIRGASLPPEMDQSEDYD